MTNEEKKKLYILLKELKKVSDQIERLELGDEIFCKGWKQLMVLAMMLTTKGYKATYSSRDMFNYVLTITALPEEND